MWSLWECDLSSVVAQIPWCLDLGHRCCRWNSPFSPPLPYLKPSSKFYKDWDQALEATHPLMCRPTNRGRRTTTNLSADSHTTEKEYGWNLRRIYHGGRGTENALLLSNRSYTPQRWTSFWGSIWRILRRADSTKKSSARLTTRSSLKRPATFAKKQRTVGAGKLI